MKKKIWIIVALVLVVLFGAAWYFRPVGTIEGPEWNILHVDGVTYLCESSAGFDIPYDRSDRGMHIGIIKSGDYIFHIYEVKEILIGTTFTGHGNGKAICVCARTLPKP